MFQKLTLDDYLQYRNSLFTRAHCYMIAHGNLTAEDSINLASIFYKQIAYTNLEDVDFPKQAILDGSFKYETYIP